MKNKGIAILSVLIVVLISFLGGFSQVQADPGVIYVDIDAAEPNNGTSWEDAFSDLQSALDAAVPGDELWVAEGTYKPTSGPDRSVSFQLQNNVSLFGGFSGTEVNQEDRDWVAHPTILSGDIGTEGDADDNSYHVVNGSGTGSGTFLDGFTITAGNANGSTIDPDYRGGGMFNNAGSPELTNVIFSGNSADYGGGIANLNGSNPWLMNVTFSGNNADFGAGMYNLNSSSPVLIDVTFSGNSAQFHGGGMTNINTSSPELHNVTISDNAASLYGGGGMYNLGWSSPELNNVIISGNSAVDGGGMYNENYSSPTFFGYVSFSDNEATNNGGGMYNTNYSTQTLTGVVFSGNSAINGGGMYNDSDSGSTLTNVTFSSNSVTDSGGGIYHYGGTLAVVNSIFSDNSAPSGVGGAIVNFATGSVTGSTFSGNSAMQGGGINNQLDSTLTVTNSTFSGNSTDSFGGAIVNNDMLTVKNSTFSGNSASVTGGGIYNSGSGTLNLINSILADSTVGGDCANAGAMGTDVMNNLIEANDGCGTPVSSADPLLGPLQDNGGPTHTMAIDQASPAFDAGDDTLCPTTDQRGVPRPRGSACDIGAYEFEGSPSTALTVTSFEDPGDGVCDSAHCTLRDAINILSAGGTIDFATGLSGRTITLDSTLHIDKDLTIDGTSLATHIIISGGDSVRVFFVDNGITATLQGLDIAHGNSTSGGGILNSGTLTVSNSTLSSNSAPNIGGAIFNNSGILTLIDSIISDNSATGTSNNGGAIYNERGTVTVTNSTIAANTALSCGGLFNPELSTMTVTNSTFSGNSAFSDDSTQSGSGGAICNGGSLAVTNSTFYGNSASYVGISPPFGFGSGGGIFNWGTLTLTNGTFSSNSASQVGSSILNWEGSTLNLINTILANSTFGVDCYNTGTMGTDVKNLIESHTDCGLPYSTAYLELGPLQDNGGPTHTMAITTASPAFDSGDDGLCPETDQRGVTRPQGLACDIGAFEYEYVPSVALTVNSPDDPGDGICDSTECTLREAVAFLAAGGTIDFDAGLSGSTITLGSPLLIRKDLTIDGTSLASHVKISGGGSVRVFAVSDVATATLQGLDIVLGWADNGGGIFNGGALTVIDSTFSGNTAADRGGGVLNIGTLTVSNSTFSGNSATNNGGGIMDFGTLMVTNTTFSSNSATNNGGGIYNYSGTLNVKNSTFSGNSASSDGGGIYNWDDGTLNLVNTILANSTDGVDCSNAGTMGTDVNNLIEANDLLHGCGTPLTSADPLLGPLQDNGGPTHTMAIDDTSPAFDAGDDTFCPVTDQRGVTRPQGLTCDIGAFESDFSPSAALTVNSTNDPGGGICDPTECTLREAIASLAPSGTIDFDASLSGGTITLGSTLTLDKDMTIDGTSLTSHIIISGGGSVRVFAVSDVATATLQGLDIVQGRADDGGGIFNGGALTVIDSTFSGNTAADRGGGVLNIGTLTVSNSTFSGNSATNNGGGIMDFGTLTVTNSTFSSNSATNNGGGIYNYSGTLEVTNSTFSGNSATILGGGIYNWDDGTLNLVNTILANSTDGGDCSNVGTMGTDVNNLIGDNSGCGTPLPYADPGLGPLQDNGGPTHTMAITTASPAFDTGDDTLCPLTDQRGVTRPQGSACDIGAYEADTPIALDDSATMLKDTVVTIDVLANDMDPDGDPLLLDSFTQPAHGTVTRDEKGTPGDTSDDQLTYLPSANFYGSDSFTYSVSDGKGGAATATVALVPAIRNDIWTRAYKLQLSSSEAIEQVLERSYQSRWYKFDVPPGSEILVTLTGLPANYDLTLYSDIAAAYRELNSPEDLLLLSAEFAPDMFSPDMFSPDMFSPDMFSPDMFSPDMFSPDMFSPDMFSPDMFSPDMFSPDMFSPDMFSPDMFSPDMFSPDMFSPDMFSPDMFSPDMFSPDMFSPDPITFASAQLRSIIAVSALEGTAAEGLRVNSWNNSGEFYVRVSGRHGAFDPDELFHLQVAVDAGVCGSMYPSLLASDTAGVSGNYKTIVITDMARMAGTEAEKAAVQDSIAAFIARNEVAGTWVDVGSDSRVADANVKADANPGCPYAKNLVADTIKGVITSYRDMNPLEYVVIIGNDDVIPFFRYPDNALLANEMNYSPPVLEGTASQASLKLGYVLGQDGYGSQIDLVQKSSILPIPDLAVGRLVETPAEIMHMLDVYAATQDGVLDTPTTALVTGYDFLSDAATAIESELRAGLGEQNPDAVHSLITERAVAPLGVCLSGSTFDGQCSWTADQMWTSLLGSRHDIILLAGHFSASSWLASDNETRLLTAELLTSDVDLENALIFSAGCHSGYNIVNEHDVPGVTREPDWAQAFARKGATFIGGTGYQYGDTDFVEYSERLYLEFSRQLRVGNGPVSIGNALVAAKQTYLADTAQMSGIHDKALVQATLFGLPMLGIDLPYGRTTPEADSSIVSATTPAPGNPGELLGLRYADVVLAPTPEPLTMESVALNNPPTYTASYLAGNDGVVSNPAQPVLPLEMYNVSVVDTVLRGVGFRGGSFTDHVDVLPLTGAAATEIRGVHTPFFTDYFYPVLPWNVNYFGALAEMQGEMTRLALMPAQYKSSSYGSITGTLRQFDSVDLRLYYSANTTSYTDEESGLVFIPAQAAPPKIADISTAHDAQASEIEFQATVVGDPTAGIQEVWIVYTIASDQATGTGKWLPVDLVQDEVDTRIWKGTLPLDSELPADIRYMVQAVNGVGLVSYATNLGVYYTPGVDPGAPPPEDQEPTEITLEVLSSTGAYGESVPFGATLKSGETPLIEKTVVFGLGSQRRLAETDGSGHANATFLLLGWTGEATLSVSFPGSEDYASSTDASSITIIKQTTQLSITPEASEVILGEDAPFTATLMDAGGRRLPGKTVLFEVRDTGNGTLVHTKAIETDFTGQAKLILPAQPIGHYSLSAQFGSESSPDLRYTGSTGGTTMDVIYDFSGFFQPVENPPTLNKVKAGQAIPIKFSLNGDQGLEILDDNPEVHIIACNPDVPLEEITETVPATASSLSYDTSENQYIYVWKTDKQWAGSCRYLVVRLVDGTEHEANFQFK